MPDVDSTEIIAIRNGFYLAANLGCTSLEVESDSQFAVRMLQSLDDYLGPHPSVILECKLLSLDFSKISMLYCFRDANQVAGELARVASSNRTSIVWRDETRYFISRYLVSDLSIV